MQVRRNDDLLPKTLHSLCGLGGLDAGGVCWGQSAPVALEVCTSIATNCAEHGISELYAWLHGAKAGGTRAKMLGKEAM